MKQDITNIRFDRLSRFFTGSRASLAAAERWTEIGDFVEGVSLRLRRVRKKDGRLRFRIYGFAVEGQMEPAQNTTDDYQAYNLLLNGTKNIAFLAGDQLWMFRLRDTGRKQTQDNRLSVVCDPGYGSTMQKAFAEISGFVKSYELYTVKDFKLTAGKMQFVIVKSLIVDGLDTPGEEFLGS